MKKLLLDILHEYSRKKAGYIPLSEREELVDKIIDAFEIKEYDPYAETYLGKIQSIGDEVI